MIADPDKTIAAILAKKNGPTPPASDEPEGDAGLETAMSDLSAALKTGDDAAAARAFRAAFEMLESEPHEEADSEVEQ